MMGWLPLGHDCTVPLEQVRVCVGDVQNSGHQTPE
jgi:hypothetical protein